MAGLGRESISMEQVASRPHPRTMYGSTSHPGYVVEKFSVIKRKEVN